MNRLSMEHFSLLRKVKEREKATELIDYSFFLPQQMAVETRLSLIQKQKK